MADYSATITAIETAMMRGELLKKEFEIDGHRVVFATWEEQVSRLEWLKQKQAEQTPESNPYRYGRITMGNTGNGLY